MVCWRLQPSKQLSLLDVTHPPHLGPGDPTFYQKTIDNIRKLYERESMKDNPIPIFGICLGNQLMGLAAGAKTYKLKFGNRYALI